MTQTPPPESAPFRHRLAQFVDSSPVQNVVLAVIVFNAVVIALTTTAVEGTATYSVLHALDSIALVVFVIELLLKLVAYGPKRFFTDGWSVFDFIVVAIALVPSSGPLSVLRALRVLRVLRVVKFLPQVRMVVEALLRSFPGIGAIALLMSLVFFVASVMSTELFGEQFPEWFGDIGKSTYSLFQIMTLESWSMGIVRPIMEVMPMAWMFFVPFILVAAFITLNLFIAVIVDTMGSLRVEREHAEEVQADAESPRVALELSDDEIAMLLDAVERVSTDDSVRPELLRVWHVETHAHLREDANRVLLALAAEPELSYADWERAIFALDRALIQDLMNAPSAGERFVEDQNALARARSIHAQFEAQRPLLLSNG